MMNRKQSTFALGMCVFACAGMTLSMVGCTGEDDAPIAQAPAPPPPPPPPPAPTLTSVADLMAELNIDKRIVLPEDKAPDNNEDRKAVLVFFDALARGNDQAFKSMLDPMDQKELAALVKSGDWKDTTSRISKIDIQTGSNAMSQKCALAVIEVGTLADLTFQPQLWYYESNGENPSFEAAPTPPNILDKLSGDWIASWHQILAAELASADEPDEKITLAQTNLDTGNSTAGSSTAPGGTAPGPSAPGGAPLRDPNRTPPTRAPQ